MQRAFTQLIGIALAGLGKFNELLGDYSVGEIVFKPEAYASDFERDIQSPFGFGIDVEVVGSNGHVRPQREGQASSVGSRLFLEPFIPSPGLTGGGFGGHANSRDVARSSNPSGPGLNLSLCYRGTFDLARSSSIS